MAMAIRNQLRKLKENWLLVLLFLILIFMDFNPLSFVAPTYFGQQVFEKAMIGAEPTVTRGFPIFPETGFAPDIEERAIIKTGYLATEVKRGEFWQADSQLKSIVKSSSSFILNENIFKQGIDRKSYFQGNYQLRVADDKYDSVISQLRNIGEITSFTENKNDITSTLADLETEIATEKARLARYRALFQEAVTIEDKIQLDDRIFDLERRIKFMEDSLQSINEQVTYSSISVTITEKQSQYATTAFIKFSELVRSFVASINTVVKIIITLIPYILVIWIIWIIARKIRRQK